MPRIKGLGVFACRPETFGAVNPQHASTGSSGSSNLLQDPCLPLVFGQSVFSAIFHQLVNFTSRSSKNDTLPEPFARGKVRLQLRKFSAEITRRK